MLEFDPRFVLSTTPTRVTYTADFKYLADGKIIHEDVKGIFTRDSRTKIAWVQQRFGVTINVIRTGRNHDR